MKAAAHIEALGPSKVHAGGGSDESVLHGPLQRPRPDSGTAAAHRVGLLVLQSTPFCNLDCSYCYLPNRNDRRQMSLETVEVVAREILSGGWAAPELTVVWHAGEPLVVPPSWYAQAFEIFEQHRPRGVALSHSFQTNGSLIDAHWIRLFSQSNVRVGLSLDGPPELHNAKRRTRNGRGSFERCIRGLHQVRAAGLPFHVISVLGAESLAQPDLLFDFFVEHGVSRLCFNVEEIEGAHGHSSLSSDDTEQSYRTFLRRILERACTAEQPIWIREFAGALAAILAPAHQQIANPQTMPLAILSIAVDGSLSTFSPELLGAHAAPFNDFCFGNIHHGGLASLLESPWFNAALGGVTQGVTACERRCAWFRWCGGGAPANKWFELGDLAGTETLYCRYTRKLLLEEVLQALEDDKLSMRRLVL